MSEYGEIFSSTVPGVKKRAARVMKSPVPQVAESVPAKAKRKYTRKVTPVAETTEVANVSPELRDRTEVVPEVPQDAGEPDTVTAILEQTSLSSYALEYLGALERLLALIGEPQRTKLVDFIVDNNIV